ncbi:MAG: hypothetical protein ACI9YL_001885 [Luteibaculaceae bacterium]|jgi:hypothetical protein
MKKEKLRIFLLVLGAFLWGSKGHCQSESIYVPGEIILNWEDTLRGEINQFIRYSSDLKFRFSDSFEAISISFDDVKYFRLAQTWYAKKKVRSKGEIYVENLFTQIIPMYRLAQSRSNDPDDVFYEYYFQKAGDNTLEKLRHSSFRDDFLPQVESYPKLHETVQRVGVNPVQLVNILKRFNRQLQ